MSARRFTDKPEIFPEAVMRLPDDHPAMAENRTLFPSTVIEVNDEFDGRLLVSGHNSRKLGKTVERGQFRGYELYSLTLEERATCSASCDARAFCYGNGMQLARRHRVGDLDFFALMLEDEIREILNDAPGLLVRLHVLGDFPSVAYVKMWADLLGDHEKLACFGYTHWRQDSPIGQAIVGLKNAFGARFRIRWSGEVERDDGVTILNPIPADKMVGRSIVCPAQTEATACCATCGICWEMAKPVAFIRHGRAVAAEIIRGSQPAIDECGRRSIAPMPIGSNIKPAAIKRKGPEIKWRKPTELLIETSYQRDLSAKSLKLIHHIVANWDWAKFKPPVCAYGEDGLFVIDGQHTAIAAASHPDIELIPILLVEVQEELERAGAFVAHNRDRLVMSPLQIMHAECAAGVEEAAEIARLIHKAGATLPKYVPPRKECRPGQVVAPEASRGVYRSDGGPERFERIVKIAVLARCAPISFTVIRALNSLFTSEVFEDVARQSNSTIAAVLASLAPFETQAQAFSRQWNLNSRYFAGARAIAEKIRSSSLAA